MNESYVTKTIKAKLYEGGIVPGQTYTKPAENASHRIVTTATPVQSNLEGLIPMLYESLYLVSREMFPEHFTDPAQDASYRIIDDEIKLLEGNRIGKN